MKTVVVFKWCRDPQDARVLSDGSVSWDGVKMSASDDDPAAMQIAKALSSEAEIVGLTVGDGKKDWAAARGADSTVVVEDVNSDVDGAVMASVLAASIKRIPSVDAVVIGDSDWDYSVTTALIGKLGLTAYAGVIDAAVDNGEIKLTTKDVDGVRVVTTRTPLLIIAKALSGEVNPPGMKQTLAARKKPVESFSVSDLDIEFSSSALSVGTRLSENKAATIFNEDDLATSVNRLLTALRDEGVLE
ncbi:electron transfer flavoprotein subunit alpha [Adlercreutzia sp. ZJ154]|uniref:electron transfer flavoprotein subunit beta/FixA family protein n=1 Tax=Adlercreutzia sp. ZJ154 TaxID=2709790 RepID=UPI0013EA1AAF|nr:electron transfer flavoprotein subunit alpha [Adlercreutzia sp. ZJ154]